MKGGGETETETHREERQRGETETQREGGSDFVATTWMSLPTSETTVICRCRGGPNVVCLNSFRKTRVLLQTDYCRRVVRLGGERGLRRAFLSLIRSQASHHVRRYLIAARLRFLSLSSSLHAVCASSVSRAARAPREGVILGTSHVVLI